MEAALAHFEGYLRSFRFPKLVRVYVPVLAPAGIGMLPSLSPYLLAIAFDATTKSAEANNTGATWTHTCTGSNLLALMGATLESTTADQFTAASYNAIAMNVANKTASSTRYGKFWYLNAPSTGAHNFSYTNTSQYNQGVAVSYSGVAQSGVDNTAIFSGNSNSVSLSITPLASGNTCWAAAILFTDAGTSFGVNTGTVRQAGSAPIVLVDSNSTISSSGYTQVLSWTSAGHYGAVMASFAPVALPPTSHGFFLRMVSI
jgi:hypothetical protein